MAEPVNLNDLQKRDMKAKAFRLADDPAYQEGMLRLRRDLLKGWENTQSDQVAEREEFFRMYVMTKMFEEQLQRVIDDGTVAEANIRREEEQNG